MSCFRPVDGEAKLVNKIIEGKIKDWKKVAKSQIKLLVLGAAESGKSTFIKQMQIIHGKGYTTQERKEFISLIHQNITSSIKLLSMGMNQLGINFEYKENQTFAESFVELCRDHEDFLPVESVNNIVKLWNDQGVQKCYKRRNEFHLLDSTAYFLNSIGRIATRDYLPNLQDILRARHPTSGICEYVFDIDKFVFGIIDVGGQKTERRKWIHCFDNVNSIIFLASLSEYDQTLPQEEIDQDIRNYPSIANLAITQRRSSSPAVHDSSSYHHQKQATRTSSSQMYRDNHHPATSNTAVANWKAGYAKVRGSNHHNSSTQNNHISSTRHYSQRGGNHHGHDKASVKEKLPPFPRTPTTICEVTASNGDDASASSSCDSQINRFRESCALFHTIVNSKWFRTTSVILFLNKTDILDEKIMYSDLALYVREYEGPARDAKAARDFILDRYVSCFARQRNNKRTLYNHFTCATDTNNIKFVFAAIKDIILQHYLENYNLI